MPGMYNSINRKSISPASTRLNNIYLLSIALKRCPIFTLSRAPRVALSGRQWMWNGLWHSASWSWTQASHFHLCELKWVLNLDDAQILSWKWEQPLMVLLSLSSAWFVADAVTFNSLLGVRVFSMWSPDQQRGILRTVLEMQILGFHPRATESEILRWAQQSVLTGSPGILMCAHVWEPLVKSIMGNEPGCARWNQFDYLLGDRKLLNFPVPQFPHLQNEDNGYPCPHRAAVKIEWVNTYEALKWDLAHSKCLIDDSWYN